MENSNQTIKSTTETVATTMFFDEDSVKCGCYMTDVLPSNNIVKYESILDFMAKPQIVANSTISTSVVVGTELWSTTMGTLLASPFWAEKLQGFQYFRGTLHLKVEINANPFQQGMIMTTWLPCSDSLAVVDPSIKAFRMDNRVGRTQLPHVMLPFTQTSSELVIPYISPYEFFDKTTGVGGWGIPSVSLMSKLATGAAGEAVLPFTIFAWFTDVELAGPMVPQMSAPNKVVNRRNKTKKQSNSSMELNAATKPISFALQKSADFARDLSQIPMLAPVTQPAQWVLNSMSGLASSFGWSKPLEERPAMVTSGQINRYAANADGVDAAYPMSLSATNRLTVTDKLSVYDADEMSMNFLKKVPAYFKSFSLLTSDVAGTVVMMHSIGPSEVYSEFTKIAGANASLYRQGPPIFYLHKAFHYWRGGIKLKLKFVKTNFHSGRLLITFTPGQNVVNTPGVSDSVVALREIIDLRGVDEYEVTIPYLLPIPYLNSEDTMGTFKVAMLNQLRAPETCAQVVEVLVFACGADDFEYQVPYRSPEVFSPEMDGEGLVVPGTIPEHTFADFGEKNPTMRYDELCIGESVKSMKQILNRYTWLTSTRTVVTSGSIYPWYMGKMKLTIAGMQTGDGYSDPISYIGAMYALFRGSMRVGLQYGGGTVSTSGVVLPTGPTTVHAGTTSGIDGYTASIINKFGSSGINFLSSVGGLPSFATVPYWNQNFASWTQRYSTSSVVGSETLPSAAFHFSTGIAQTKGQLLRSCGDDFQFCYFVGAPPILV